MTVIPAEILLDDYYANLHGAYNSMRECFTASALTQDGIAAALDIDKSLVSRRLNGSENLTLKTLSHMGTAMNCRLHISFISYDNVGTTNTYTSVTTATLNSTATSISQFTAPANQARSLEPA